MGNIKIPTHILNSLDEEALDKIIDYLPHSTISELAVLHNNPLARYMLNSGKFDVIKSHTSFSIED